MCHQFGFSACLVCLSIQWKADIQATLKQICAKDAGLAGRILTVLGNQLKNRDQAPLATAAHQFLQTLKPFKLRETPGEASKQQSQQSERAANALTNSAAKPLPSKPEAKAVKAQQQPADSNSSPAQLNS